MTQKTRWLAALALLLAFGASAVRAEEEEEISPPKPPTAELLPPPLAARDGRCNGGVCTQVLPTASPSDMWSFFLPPSPAPGCPCPVPFLSAGVCPCGEVGGLCPVCPCPAGCGTYACPACPLCPACAQGVCTQPTEYVVEMKMMEGRDDDEPKVLSQPRVLVLEGQAASVQTGAEGSKEQTAVHMQATVNKADKGVLLDLSVVKSCSHTPGNNVLQAHAETTENRCVVPLGKATKVELTHDSDGACTSWVEVTVTQAEQEAPKAAACTCPVKRASEEEDADDSMIGNLADAVQGFFDSFADMASDAADGSAYAPAALPDIYLEHPPQYCPAEPPAPMAREICSQASCRCPACTCPSSACTQCAAVEAVKKAAVQIRIGDDHGRKTVEVCDGEDHWKATAERVVVHDGCIELEGVEMQHADGSAFSGKVKLKLENAEILIGD